MTVPGFRVLSQQPNAFPSLLTSNLASGIVDFVLPVNNAMMSPTGLWADTAAPNAGRIVKAGGGNTKRYNGSTQYSRRPTVPAAMKGGSFVKECSFLAVLIENSSASTSFALSYCGSTSIMGIGTGSTGGRAACFFRNDAGGGDGGLQATSGLSYQNAHGSIVIVTRSESRNQTRIYVDGTVGLDTTAGTMGATTPVDSATGILYRGSAGNFWAGAVALGAVWNRALTQAEVFALSVNPWQIFGVAARPIILNSSSGGANTAVTLSPATFSYTPASLSAKTNRFATLSGTSFTYTPNSLTAVTSRKATLSPVSYSYSIASLSAVTGRKVTLSPAAFAYTPNSLTTLLTRKATLSPVSWSWTINDLSAVFVGKTAYTVTLSPASFAFTPVSLTATYASPLATVARGKTGPGAGPFRGPYDLSKRIWKVRPTKREEDDTAKALVEAQQALEAAQEATKAKARQDAIARLFRSLEAAGVEQEITEAKAALAEATQIKVAKQKRAAIEMELSELQRIITDAIEEMDAMRRQRRREEEDFIMRLLLN